MWAFENRANLLFFHSILHGVLRRRQSHGLKDSHWSLHRGWWDRAVIQISLSIPIPAPWKFGIRDVKKQTRQEIKEFSENEEITCPEWLMAFRRWTSVENTWPRLCLPSGAWPPPHPIPHPFSELHPTHAALSVLDPPHLIPSLHPEGWGMKWI